MSKGNILGETLTANSEEVVSPPQRTTHQGWSHTSNPTTPRRDMNGWSSDYSRPTYGRSSNKEKAPAREQNPTVRYKDEVDPTDRAYAYGYDEYGARIPMRTHSILVDLALRMLEGGLRGALYEGYQFFNLRRFAR
jgi:hypothetical protein